MDGQAQPVSVPALLCKAWGDIDSFTARSRICKGMVKVGPTTIGLPDMEMARSALAGQTLTMGDRSITVNANGDGFRRVIVKNRDQMAML